MSEVKIKSAYMKDGLFLKGDVNEPLPGNCSEDRAFKRDVPTHEDLRKAFQKLHKHLALLCDEIEPEKKIKNLDKWDHDGLYVKDEKGQELPLPDADPKDKELKFHVTGFSIKGSDDNEGCSIKGYKIGKYGTVDLDTPKCEWTDKKYPHISELNSDIQDCIYEVEQYLFEGKRSPDAQMKIDFPEKGGSENYSEEGL